MGLNDLFKILADYLNFAVDLLLLRGMEKYGRLGAISSELVSFFVAGVLVAYLIASMKRVPGYESKMSLEPPPSAAPQGAASTDDSPQEREQTSDVAGFVVLSIFGAAVFHGFLILYCKLFGDREIGSLKDTLNAAFAVGAVYNPLNAMFKQVARAAKLLATISRPWAILAAIILLVISFTYFAMLYYWIYALAEVHRLSQTYMLGPMGVIVLLTIVVLALVWRTERHSALPPSAAAQHTVAADGALPRS